MLVLGRKPGQSIRIGDDITVTFVRHKRHGIEIGIDAPKSTLIMREEVTRMDVKCAEPTTGKGLDVTA